MDDLAEALHGYYRESLGEGVSTSADLDARILAAIRECAQNVPTEAV